MLAICCSNPHDALIKREAVLCGASLHSSAILPETLRAGLYIETRDDGPDALVGYEPTVEALHGHIVQPNLIQVNFFTGLLRAVSPHLADCAKAEDPSVRSSTCYPVARLPCEAPGMYLQ